MAMAMDGILLEAFTAVLVTVATALAGGAAASLRRLRERQRAEDIALEALLRMVILDAYSEYVIGGRPISVDRKQEIEQVSQAYFQLGGNGTAKHQVEELMRLRPWVEAGKDV